MKKFMTIVLVTLGLSSNLSSNLSFALEYQDLKDMFEKSAESCIMQVSAKKTQDELLKSSPEICFKLGHASAIADVGTAFLKETLASNPGMQKNDKTKLQSELAQIDKMTAT